MTQTAARWQAEYSPDVGWVVTDRPAPGESYDNAFFCQFEANAVSLAVMLNHYEQAKAALLRIVQADEALGREYLRDVASRALPDGYGLALSSPPATQEKQG
jgi:hypothetical protein